MTTISSSSTLLASSNKQQGASSSWLPGLGGCVRLDFTYEPFLFATQVLIATSCHLFNDDESPYGRRPPSMTATQDNRHRSLHRAFNRALRGLGGYSRMYFTYDPPFFATRVLLGTSYCLFNGGASRYRRRPPMMTTTRESSTPLSSSYVKQRASHSPLSGLGDCSRMQFI